MLEMILCPVMNCTTEREAKYNIKEQNNFLYKRYVWYLKL